MTPAETRLLAESASRLGTRLDGEAIARLGRFLDILVLWNARIRLTGERDPAVLVRKHTVDSLAPAAHLPAAGLVIDIGSGGGFPGLVLGCARPDLELVLIEARRRPVSFLREAIRTIPLPQARAIEGRAEAAAGVPLMAGRASLVVTRALRLDAFLPLAAPLLAPDGVAIAMQTPRTRPPAASALALAGTRDYVLPGGERRRLLIFRRPVPSLPRVC